MSSPASAAADDEVTMETREASPAHFLIKIDSFSLLDEHGIDKLKTREFESGGYKWKLIIYPDGHGTGNDGKDYVSVYLAMANASALPANWEVNAVFSISLFNHISGNYLYALGEHEETGNGEETGRSLSVFLRRVVSGTCNLSERVRPRYTIRIIDQSSGHHHHQHTGSGRWFSAAESFGRGWLSFIKLSSLNDPNKGFIVKDCCLLEIELTVQARASS